jgi:chromosome segregation ATPase
MASKVEKFLVAVSSIAGLGAAWFIRGRKIKRLRKEAEEAKQKQEQFEAYLDELEQSVTTLEHLNGRLTELNEGINSARLENGEMDEEKLNKVLTELYKKYDIPDIDIESDIFDFS